VARQGAEGGAMTTRRAGRGTVAARVRAAERATGRAVLVAAPAWVEEWGARAREAGLPVTSIMCTSIPLLPNARGAYGFASGEVWLRMDEDARAMRQILLHEFGHAARGVLSTGSGERDLVAGWARDERETWQAAYVLARDWSLTEWMSEAELDRRLVEVEAARRRYETVGALLGCGWREPVEAGLDLGESLDPPRHAFAPASLVRPAPARSDGDAQAVASLGGSAPLVHALRVAREMCGLPSVNRAPRERIRLRDRDDLALAIGGLSDLLYAPFAGTTRLRIAAPTGGARRDRAWHLTVERRPAAPAERRGAVEVVRVSVIAEPRAEGGPELGAAWIRWLASWAPAASGAGARRLLGSAAP